jgi:hypothetical protein
MMRTTLSVSMRGSLLGSKALKQPKYNYNTVNKNKTIFLFGLLAARKKLKGIAAELEGVTDLPS